MLEGGEEGGHSGQLKDKHLLLKAFLLFHFDDEVDDHVDSFEGEWFVVVICPHNLAAAVEEAFLLPIGDPILHVELYVPPKVSILFVNGVRFPASVAEGPNYHRYVFKSEGAFVEASLDN